MFIPKGRTRYEVTYLGTRRSTGCTNRRDANRIVRAFAKDEDNRRAGIVVAANVTVGGLLDLFRNWNGKHEAYDPKFLARHDRLLRPHLGQKRVVDLDAETEHVDYYASRRGARAPKPCSDATLQRNLDMLNRALELYGLAHPESGFFGIRFDAPGKTVSRETWFTSAEVARLCRAARGRIWDLDSGGWNRHASDTNGEEGKLVLRDAAWRARQRPLLRILLLGVCSGSCTEVMLEAG